MYESRHTWMPAAGQYCNLAREDICTTVAIRWLRIERQRPATLHSSERDDDDVGEAGGCKKKRKRMSDIVLGNVSGVVYAVGECLGFGTVIAPRLEFLENNSTTAVAILPNRDAPNASSGHIQGVSDEKGRTLKSPNNTCMQYFQYAPITPVAMPPTYPPSPSSPTREDAMPNRLDLSRTHRLWGKKATPLHNVWSAGDTVNGDGWVEVVRELVWG
ncbi:hypothetical protein BDY19DRAFT_909145 [Irpex rosettiformis]|uniref:Uncharacterized protein n=1 Tax=Irpex rosettiformis TaxID=378272 RepID=A0ACB8TTE3_9APHY|nr:hypothetical protein BDY19DRAFT_909145 [Irpex rosettiformis]